MNQKSLDQKKGELRKVIYTKLQYGENNSDKINKIKDAIAEAERLDVNDIVNEGNERLKTWSELEKKLIHYEESFSLLRIFLKDLSRNLNVHHIAELVEDAIIDLEEERYEKFKILLNYFDNILAFNPKEYDRNIRKLLREKKTISLYIEEFCDFFEFSDPAYPSARFGVPDFLYKNGFDMSPKLYEIFEECEINFSEIEEAIEIGFYILENEYNKAFKELSEWLNQQEKEILSEINDEWDYVISEAEDSSFPANENSISNQKEIEILLGQDFFHVNEIVLYQKIIELARFIKFDNGIKSLKNSIKKFKKIRSIKIWFIKRLIKIRESLERKRYKGIWQEFHMISNTLEKFDYRLFSDILNVANNISKEYKEELMRSEEIHLESQIAELEQEIQNNISLDILEKLIKIEQKSRISKLKKIEEEIWRLRKLFRDINLKKENTIKRLEAVEDLIHTNEYLAAMTEIQVVIQISKKHNFTNILEDALKKFDRCKNDLKIKESEFQEKLRQVKIKIQKNDFQNVKKELAELQESAQPYHFIKIVNDVKEMINLCHIKEKSLILRKRFDKLHEGVTRKIEIQEKLMQINLRMQNKDFQNARNELYEILGTAKSYQFDNIINIIKEKINLCEKEIQNNIKRKQMNNFLDKIRDMINLGKFIDAKEELKKILIIAQNYQFNNQINGANQLLNQIENRENDIRNTLTAKLVTVEEEINKENYTVAKEEIKAIIQEAKLYAFNDIVSQALDKKDLCKELKIQEILRKILEFEHENKREITKKELIKLFDIKFRKTNNYFNLLNEEIDYEESEISKLEAISEKLIKTEANLTLSNLVINSGLDLITAKKIGKFLVDHQVIDEFPRVAKLFAKKLKIKTTDITQGFRIFVSYSRRDSNIFHVAKIAKELEKYQEIETVFFYEGVDYENIIKYMNDNIRRSDVFISFCSQNALQSKYIEMEWQAALAESKLIIPIFLDYDNVPSLIKPYLGVQFIQDNLTHNVEEIYKVLLKQVGSTQYQKDY
ncbi:MAG: toll/interleukin-1 receptor domain-containing protein [Promethearchaeota archaeon]